MADLAEIKNNLAQVRENIAQAAKRSGRAPEDVTLVVVTKTVGAEIVRELYNLGERDFGENRSHVGVPKAKALALPDANWHFIGHLQRRKAREIFPLFTYLHSLDRVSLAATVDGEASAAGAKVKAFIEVKTSAEASKQGASEEEARILAEASRELESVEIIGLMTMAPLCDTPEDARPYFARLRKLRDKIQADCGVKLPHLSMGMSHDYIVAVEEGATFVRVGTAIVGEVPEIGNAKSKDEG